MPTPTELRNKAFVRTCLDVYVRQMREGRAGGVASIAAEALECRPPAHFVSYDHASRMLHRITREGGGNATNRQTQWNELYEQVRSQMDAPRCLPFEQALTFVLNYCRPSRYHICLDTAIKILRPHFERRTIVRPRSQLNCQPSESASI